MNISYEEITNSFRPFFPDIELYRPQFVHRRAIEIFSKLSITNCTDFRKTMESNYTSKDILPFLFFPPTTDLFRDQNFWNALYSDVLPLLKDEIELYFWLPNVTSGEDVFALLILLDQLPEMPPYKVYVSHSCIEILESIKKGECAYYSSIDFSDLQLPLSPHNYYTVRNNSMYFDIQLLSHIEWMHQSTLFELPSHFEEKFNLVIFRNKFLYLQHKYHIPLLHFYAKHMAKNSFLGIGIKDSYSVDLMPDVFKDFNLEERIYAKR